MGTCHIIPNPPWGLPKLDADATGFAGGAQAATGSGGESDGLVVK